MSIDDLEPIITLIFLFGIMCWLLVLSTLLSQIATQSGEEFENEGNHYWIDY